MKLTPFAEACLSTVPVNELVDALNGPVDSNDLVEWDITEAEWRLGIESAIAELLRD